MLEHHLKQLAEDLNLIEPPIKNETGLYPFQLTEEMTISCEQLDPGTAFYTPLGPLPTVKREEFLILLMQANFLGQGTGGGAIGLDENEKNLTLSFVLPYDMNYKLFKEALEDFANYADYWKGEIKRHIMTAEENIL